MSVIPTVEGETFDEMVTRLREIMSIESAIDIARLAFGLGGDVVDVTNEPDDTEQGIT